MRLYRQGLSTCEIARRLGVTKANVRYLRAAANGKKPKSTYRYRETNCKRLPKNADALFTQLEKQLRTIDEAETDGYFPAIAAALFRMVKAVSRNRSLLVEYGALMGSLATICEKGSEEDLSLLRIFASSLAKSVCKHR